MSAVLISAFEPFDHDPENSSLLILKQLPTQPELKTVVLPVSYASSWIHLRSAIEEFQPKVVLCMGQADTRHSMSLEEVALNVIHSRIPDAEGLKPENMAIEVNGDLALRATLPNLDLQQELLRRQLECEISYSAGAYVCNFLLYRTLEFGKTRGFQAGFAHWPLLVEQRLGPSVRLRPQPKLSLRQAVQTLEVIIQYFQQRQ